ncbi:hypothetical protein J6590_088175 [Homalodisca vitripennis]|nr:hypothetical protein J6590_088175 [Homalodisca vitripennis]
MNRNSIEDNQVLEELLRCSSDSESDDLFQDDTDNDPDFTTDGLLGDAKHSKCDDFNIKASRSRELTSKLFVNMSSSNTMRKNKEKQTNHMSISLQTAKFVANQIDSQPISFKNPQTSNILSLDKVDLKTKTVESNLLSLNKKTSSLKKGPPFTATKLEPSETIEEFYNKNIETFMANSSRNHSNNNTSSFLVRVCHRLKRT